MMYHPAVSFEFTKRFWPDVPLQFPECFDRMYHLSLLSVLTGCTPVTVGCLVTAGFVQSPVVVHFPPSVQSSPGL